MKVRLTVGMALGLLLGGMLAVPAAAQGPDGRWPLQPRSGVSRYIAPFLEGWYNNGDGTYTYSLGYSNLNEETVEIPLGEGNFIEPAQFHGMQPTTFHPGKNRGLFAVTVPANMADVDIWWTITAPSGEVTRVPARHTWNAYELDYRPRPHGTRPPEVSFDGTDGVGTGIPGLMSQRTIQASVGERVLVEMDVEDVSINDPNDFRVNQGTELRVTWMKHQGPVGGMIEFERHASTMELDQEGRGGGGGANQPERRGPGPEVVPIMDEGTTRVWATFDMPGEYVLLGQVDNFRRPDSSSGDQCCWTNGYVRVNVTE